MYSVKPGDILVVSTTRKQGWRRIFSGEFWIKAHSRMTGVPERSRRFDHVVIVSHQDESGTLWGIEGKPSKVGYVDVDLYLKDPLTLSNAKQVKTDDQRLLIVKVAREMLGSPYDWGAILTLSTAVLRVNLLWNKVTAQLLIKDWNENAVPAHVICSSYADLACEKAGLDSPRGTQGTRFTTPADWSEFIFNNEASWAG
jgi:hypothetical protein